MSRGRARSSAPRRQAREPAVRRRLLVGVEGALTEPQYLAAWARLNRGVIVTIDDVHGVPLTLVRRMIELRRTAKRNERRGSGIAPDQYWVVFDCDEHPEIPAAMALARDHEIEVAFSNPSIELWFLLHTRDQTAALSHHDARRAIRETLGITGKHLAPNQLGELVEAFSDARGRAQGLDRKHELDGSRPGENPSSGVWRLVDAIRDQDGDTTREGWERPA